MIYANDMSGAVSNKLLLYADDSAILVADKINVYLTLKLSYRMNLSLDLDLG